MAYNPSFSSSPYAAGVPSPAAPGHQFPPGFNMMPGQMPQFPMNAVGIPPQQQQQQMIMMQQRMHPTQQNATAMGVSTPQKPFNSAQGTPNSAPSQQSQFPVPQNQPGTPQPQNQSGTPQQPNSATTPQTPTFPSGGQGPNANGASSASSPLSPGAESKEKERFSLLLDINQELLFESVQLQNTLQELRKEHKDSNSGESKAGENEKKPSEEENIVQQDYVQCVSRTPSRWC